MKAELITFETAKLAKEGGFKVTISGKGTFIIEGNKPTQSALQRWLREVHSIYITALPFRDVENEVELCWYYTLVEDSEELNDILCNESHLGASDNNFNTYEEALEKGLQEALKLI